MTNYRSALSQRRPGASRARIASVTTLSLLSAAFVGVLAPGAAQAAPVSPAAVPAPVAPGTCAPIADSQATLLYFQDTHEFAPVERPEGMRGGIANLQTVLKEEGSELASTDVVFGGDLAGGTLFGGVYRGAPFIEAFNTMGVDVANFGQHDFDFGAEHTNTLIEASEFDWVSSNLTYPDGTPFAPNTTLIRETGGLTIGYLGLTTGMHTTTAAGDVIERDQVEAATEAAEYLESQGVDLIVAVTQLSAAASQNVMDAVPTINVLLREEGGAASLGSTVVLDDGRLIIEPRGDYGTVARVDATLTECGIELVSEQIVVDDSVTPDPELLELQNFYVDSMEAELSAQLSTAPATLDLAQAGNIVADAFREYTGSDLAWTNGGGARAEIPAGPVTLHTLFSVLPFDNKMMTIEVTGAQLIEGLEQGADSSPSGGGGFPRPSGFDYVYVPTAEPGNRIHNVTLDDGFPIELDATYSLTLTNYVVGGGNNVVAFTDAPVIWDDGTADLQALIAYAEKREEIVAVGDRALVTDTIPTPAPTTPATPTPTETSTESPALSATASPAPAASTAPTDASEAADGALAKTGAEGFALVAGIATLFALAGTLLVRRRNA